MEYLVFHAILLIYELLAVHQTIIHKELNHMQKYRNHKKILHQMNISPKNNKNPSRTVFSSLLIQSCLSLFGESRSNGSFCWHFFKLSTSYEHLSPVLPRATIIICTILRKAQVPKRIFIQFFLWKTACEIKKRCYRADVYYN